MRNLFLFLSVLLASSVFAQTGECGFYIHSEFDSECINTLYPRDKPEVDHEMETCLLACVGSKVKYRVAGNTNGFSFQWQVAGASNYSVASNGTYVTVQWPEMTTEGQIILTATHSDGSICTEAVCVKLIEKPTASFTSNPAFSYIDNGTPMLEVCDGQEVQLVNTSSSNPDAPIVGYSWRIGSHTYSTENLLFTADINEFGEYGGIELEVINECGCKDYFSIKLHISKFPTLKVDCYGTACEGNEVTYTVVEQVCDQYLWSIDGGEILSGEGTPTISVAWNDIDDGYGYLGLDGSHCGQEMCPNLTYLPVPVITDHVPIDGPTVLCKGELYSFKLPTWASTEYNWSVTSNGQSYGINVSSHPSELKIQLNHTGTFMVNCSYQNEFLNCSGNAIPLEIKVKEPVSIVSENQICQGESVLFSTDFTGTSPTQWKLYDQNMELIYLITTPSFNLTFPDAGSYTIEASNPEFCEVLRKSIIINPAPIVETPDVSNWETKVCPNGGYLFSIPEIDDAYYVHWEADCGEPNASDGLEYNVEFSGNICDIKMFYVDKLTGCMSQPYIHHLSEFTPDDIQWNIPNLVCANSSFEVSVPAQDNVLYEWSVSNPIVASIAGGMYDNTVNIQTNAISQNFNLILKRGYCDTDVETSTSINMQDNVTPDFNVPSEICQNEILTLTPTVPNNVPGSWTWIIGNNLPVGGYTFQDTIKLKGIVPITLKYTNICGDIYSIVKTIYVNPAPEVAISSTVAGLQLVFTASTQGDEVGEFTYKWYKGSQYLGSSNPIAVAYPLVFPTTYICVITNETTGCKSININEMKESEPCQIPQGSVFSDINCQTGVYTRTAYTSDSLKWDISNKSTLVNMEISGEHNEIFSVTYRYPGYYVTTASEKIDSCYYFSTRVDTIPLIPKMRIDYSCAGSNMVQLNLINTSCILPDVQMATPHWKINGQPVPNVVNRPSGTYYIELEMGYTYMGNYHVCYAHDSIVVDRENADFNISSAPYCEDMPIAFNSTAQNALSYQWTFNQNLSNFQNLSPDPILGLPNFEDSDVSYSVSLNVQDKMGCTSTSSQAITVNKNQIGGHIVADTLKHCAGSIWQLNYTVEEENNQNGITQYDWSSLEWGNINNNAMTYNASQTGTYQVNVKDNKGCKFQSLYKNICFKNSPLAMITANDHFCSNEELTLLGNNGDYQYTWTLNGNTYNSPNLNLSSALLEPGNYTAFLAVSNGDCIANAQHHFQIHSAPTTPGIMFGGNRCIHEPPVILKTQNNLPVHWNTGVFSSSIGTFTSGYHSAYTVDNNTGCRSDYRYFFVPEAPDFSELMTGCYKVCKRNLPKFILGPSGWYNEWGWFLNGNPIADGTWNIPQLPIPYFGSYDLKLIYGGDCHVESEPLYIQEADTCHCQVKIELEKKPRCFVESCHLFFSTTISITNLSTTHPVDIVNINMPNGFIINYSGANYIPPNGQISVDVEFELSNYTPALAHFEFNFIQTKEPCNYSWYCDLSPYLKRCIGTCGHGKWEKLFPIQELSNTELSYFDFTIFVGDGMQNVQISSEQAQIYFSNYDPNGYLNGLFGIGTAQLQDLAHTDQKICFTIFGCFKGRICSFEICISALELWDMLHHPPLAPEQNTAQQIKDLEYSKVSSFNLYPNPAKNILNIKSKGLALQSYQISSLTGSILLEGQQTDIDISRLASGTYLIKLTDQENRIYYQSFVKQ